MRRTFRAGDFQPDPEKDFTEESRFHLEMIKEDLLAQGLSPEEANLEAERRFGDIVKIREAALKEESRRQRKMTISSRLETLGQDIRYAIRTLLRAPGIALLTILILAVGVGANTAVFSVLKAVFLQPLPFPQAEELTFIWNRNIRTGGYGPSTFPDYQDLRNQNLTFEEMGAFSSLNLNLTGGEEPVRIRAAQVTASVFDVLGIPPAMGRTLLREEDLSGRRVVVLSHHLWQERFASDPAIVGSTVQIDGGGFGVVGIMPETFEHPTPWGMTDPYLAWIPIRDEPWRSNRDSYNYQVLARLRDGVPLRRGQEDLVRIGETLEEQFPDTNENDRAWVRPLHGLLYGDSGSTIFFVLLAAGAVLLVACGNIAGFLLARAANRRTEMAVRASLGAGRGRIVRQLLTESLLLAVAGGVAAVFLASWSMGGLKALIPPTLPRSGDIALDGGVLLFALILSLATGVIFGMAPALAASKTRLTEALKEGGRSGGTGRKQIRARNAFVVAQIALSLSLVNAGLLLIRSQGALRDVEQGFDAEHALTLGLSLGGERYDEPEERMLFFDHLQERLAAMPGVRSAGFTSKLPLLGGTNGPTVTEEQFAEDPSVQGVLTEVTSLRGDYFASMGIPLRMGRELTSADSDTVATRVVINEAAARRFWPDQEPLGKRFGFEGENPEWMTVVGVVGNVRQWSPGSTPRPEVYWDYAQNPRSRMFITLNADGDPRTLVPAARAAVLAVDPLQPVSEIQTMEELLASQLSGREFYTLLVGVFGALAVLLAAAGIYGLISYFVVQRSHEMGIRLALGAARPKLIRLVLGQAMATVLWGLLAGAAGICVTTMAISGLLFGVQPLDPPTLMAGTGLVVLVGILAALLPSLRGTRLSPVEALRSD